MRRIAADLDAGTMTLYHYVRTKDELLPLVVDAVMGEVVIPDAVPFPTDWRAAITLIARAIARRAHPSPVDPRHHRRPAVWSRTRAPLRPIAAGRRVARFPLDEKFDIVNMVDAYVFGFCLHERNNVREGHRDPFDRAMVDYTNDLIATGDYPQLSALVSEYGLEGTWAELAATSRIRSGSSADSSACSTASRPHWISRLPPRSRMRAVSATKFDADDPLAGFEIGDRPEPEPPVGWTRVAVKAAALNQHDIWTLRGVGITEDRLPMILGCDAAGIDDEGNEVIVHAVVSSDDWRGDETLDPKRSLLSEIHQGTLAEYVVVPRRNLVPKPADLTFAEAACLPTAWLTAYRMLFTNSGAPPGSTILVQGAGGGVSTALISLAARRATASG